MPTPTTEAEMLARLQGQVAKGDKYAQWMLGHAYELGYYGLSKSMELAAQYLELSAEQGCMGAQFNIGLFFSNGTGTRENGQKEGSEIF